MLLTIIGYIVSLVIISQVDSDKKTTETIKVELNVPNETSDTSINRLSKSLKDLLVIISAPIFVLIGVLVTLPIFEKKIIENHIQKRVEEIQDANSKLNIENQIVIDKYSLQGTFPLAVDKAFLKELVDDINELYIIALKCSSEVNTLMLYLKLTMQRLSRTFDPNRDILYTNQLIQPLIGVLALINFFTKRVAKFPKKVKISEENIFDGQDLAFVKDKTFSTIKNFDTGVINDQNSAYYYLFYNEILDVKTPLLTRAAFQFYNNPLPVAYLLNKYRIFAPWKLMKPNKSKAFVAYFELYLISFNTLSFIEGNKTSYRTELYYANTLDRVSFIGSLSLKKIQDKYTFTPNSKSNFDFLKAKRFECLNNEILKITFEHEYLKKTFLDNESLIKESIGKIKYKKVRRLFSLFSNPFTVFRKYNSK